MSAPAVAGGLYLPPGHPEIRRVREALQVPNPAYAQWEARSARTRYPGPEPEVFLDGGGEIPDGPWAGGWWAPRHAPVDVGWAVRKMVCPEASRVGLAPGFKLRPYQGKALEAWLAKQSGTVVAPCGAGKTCIGLGGIARLSTPALVLVHTLDLAKQWIERIGAQLAGASVGLVGDGVRDDGQRVTVATLQTLARWGWWDRYEWGKRFGLAIVDEAHHAPAETIAAVLSTMPGQYRLGLTATPTRHDGLTDLVYWSCGPEAYRIEARDLQRAGAVLVPRVRWVATGYEPIDTEHAAKRMGALVADPERNSEIVRLAREAVKGGRSVLVLSERVDHCRKLATAIGRDGTACDVLVGEVGTRDRADLLDRMRAGTLRCVTATTVADEGLDVPALDTVILATPTGNVPRVEQRIGRALRPADGKAQPEVVDLVDRWGPWEGYAWRRWRLYRDMGWRPAIPPVKGREAA